MTPTNWTLAVAIGAVLALGTTLDADPVLDTPSAVARQAAQEARAERAAIQLCIRAFGPGAAATWDANGFLHCKPRKGSNTDTLIVKGAV